MSRSITLGNPQPATPSERAAISQLALEHEKRLFVSGEPEPTESYLMEREAYYAEALMSVYPIQDSATRLCLVASRTLPFYDHGQVFGWDYAVWLSTTPDEWQLLDQGDSHLPLANVLELNASQDKSSAD